MADMTHTIPMSAVNGRINLRIKVTGVRVWKARMTVALWIINLASLVAPFKVAID
jgi:hypothetical protein